MYSTKEIHKSIRINNSYVPKSFKELKNFLTYDDIWYWTGATRNGYPVNSRGVVVQQLFKDLILPNFKGRLMRLEHYPEMDVNPLHYRNKYIPNWTRDDLNYIPDAPTPELTRDPKEPFLKQVRDHMTDTGWFTTNPTFELSRLYPVLMMGLNDDDELTRDQWEKILKWKEE